MKKSLPILVTISSALVIAAGIATSLNHGFKPIFAEDTTVAGQIIFDYSSLTVTDDSGAPYQVYCSLSSQTKSGYAVSVSNISAGGTSAIDFKKSEGGKTYMFVSSGEYSGGAYFNIDIDLTNLYSFTNVVIDGIFVHSNDSITYRYTFTTSDTNNVEWDSELGMACLYLGSYYLDNNYKSISLEKITINYSCLA